MSQHLASHLSLIHTTTPPEFVHDRAQAYNVVNHRNYNILVIAEAFNQSDQRLMVVVDTHVCIHK